MKYMLMLSGLAAALLVTGCQNKPDEELTRVPPPAYEETVAPEPIPAPEVQGPQVQTQPPSQVAPQPADPEPIGGAAPQANTYTVRKGDTLWSIAQRVYGDGQRWVDIVDANPGLSPNKLRVGQTITLP